MRKKPGQLRLPWHRERRLSLHNGRQTQSVALNGLNTSFKCLVTGIQCPSDRNKETPRRYDTTVRHLAMAAVQIIQRT